MIHKDIRETVLYEEAESLHKMLRQPGTGQISDAAELHVSPDGMRAVFAGTLVDALIGSSPTRICSTHLATGDTRVLTFGPNVDRLPRFSPDSKYIAFLSDRHKAGDFQLYLLDPACGALPTTRVDGWVEYLHWSPDGKRILLGVAGHGADISGGQGAVTSKRKPDDTPSWMPSLQTGDEDYFWRRAWVYELATNSVRPITHAGINIWEAAWCGNEAITAVTSPRPGEGHWYEARLHVVDLESGTAREVYKPKDQLGWPAASPSGKHVAIVEAVCSDRWLVAGDVRLIDTTSGKIRCANTGGVDITYSEWRSDRYLLLAGRREFATVVGLYDVTSDVFSEVWSSTDISTGGIYITVSGFNETGDCVLVGESFVRAPELAVIQQGKYRAVRSFGLAPADQEEIIGTVDQVCWKAPDGLAIQGWLLQPRNGRAPYPLVMCVHGGPVWQWRPMWLGRGSVPLLMLVKHGYALFLPNPRGSTGQGQDFVRHVMGDVGGADTYDYLSGLDHLVEQGIADPNRLGVTGISYGGFMASWLITQDSRFAAAVPVAPVTNQVTAHLISNIPHFVIMSLADTYTNPGGKYFQRSPIMFAHQAKTPTLNICGAQDRCTPPEEALQFHNALLENGVRSVLATYPEEGHGIRKWPASIDYAARVVDWFQTHMPAAVAK